ncbi:3-dehydroquinate synthase II [Olea europaea subsp. europaea]|uniref:3-dehydroquinate synthase II n=1 Tax=Olea europaea subsp. europaea TaxID=158383 RepID=A0A8S0U8C6_OLEEU|nr:3-dehydroquinate synthase II [Olea europaea subsp. europaea]
MAVLFPSAYSVGKWGSCRLIDYKFNSTKIKERRIRFHSSRFVSIAMCACNSSSKSLGKKVWIWTENKQVMTAAVERGWNTFIFSNYFRDLAVEWSSIALIHPLFIEEGNLIDGEQRKVANFFEISSPQQLEKLQPLKEEAENVVVDLLGWQVIPAENIVAAIQGTQKTVFAISKTSSEAQIFLEVVSYFNMIRDVLHLTIIPIALIHPLFIEEGNLIDGEQRKVANFFEISSPQQLEKLQPLKEEAENVVVDLLGWQVIPAENIVAAIQGTQKTVFAISKTSSEAQIFLEALEHGLGGVVLKTEDIKSLLELKDYLDRRNEECSLLKLTTATVTNIQMAGMGDRACVDLCSLLRPGEGLLVGSFARGLFLVHSECLESNYISSRPFRVNAGPVHAYVSVPGGKTSYLSELKAGKEVIVVDQNGMQRTAIIGRVKIETRPLILVEAKIDLDNHTTYSILLQNAETVALVSSAGGHQQTAIPVTSLKIGDEILMRLQGGARHTGIEIEEFIVEK